MSTSRRRTTARRVADDDIEDPQSSQGASQNQRRGSTRQPLKRAQTHAESDDDDGDEDDEAPIDVDNLADAPLTASAAPTLKGYAVDWARIQDRVMQSAKTIIEVGEATADTAEGQEREKGIKDLDKVMRELIDVAADMNAHEKSLEKLHDKLRHGEEITDLREQYRADVVERTNAYKAKTSRQKYAKVKEYASFREQVFQVEHPDEPMPPVSEFIPKEDGDESDDDDDMEIGGVSQNFKCPLTLSVLDDPYTSQPCGHSYSGAAIKDYFKPGRKGERKQCPAAGCSTQLQWSDVQPDGALARRVKLWERRQKRAAERAEEEVDEVVED
ncbi:hypothetical protein HDZ31DRAFT_71895 [Schizophyllum fasciatum]